MSKREGRLLRAKEAARYLGISVATLRRMEKSGVLSPYRTLGGHRRYSIEMLEEYLENSRTHTSLGRAQTEGPRVGKPRGGA